MKAADILRGSLAKLHAYGWIQDEYGDSECGYCSLGAIAAIGLTYAESLEASSCLLAATGAASVDGWNDTPGRTFEEVEAAFLRAIEIAEADE